MAKKKRTDKPDLPNDKFLPVAIDSAASARRIDEADRIVIFSIDGVDYDMPKVPQTDIALEYLALEAEGDGEHAAYVLLERTIGVAGIEALRAVKGLSDKEFDGVVTRVQAIALPKGQKRAAGRQNG